MVETTNISDANSRLGDVMEGMYNSSGDSKAMPAWPIENAAEEATLYVPGHWPGGTCTNESKARCRIRFDQGRKLIKVVNMENNVLDLIDPNDVVGCEVEIKLIDPSGAEDARLAFRNSSNNNNTGGTGTGTGTLEDENATTTSPTASACNIFAPLSSNAEGIFQCDNIAPKSPFPFDLKATAVLTIYNYPRRDPAHESWLYSSCGLNSSSSESHPHPEPTSTPRDQLGHRHAQHKRFQVAASEDFSQISALVRAIRKVSGLTSGQRSLLVVINPTSGTGKSRDVYDKTVKPVLEQGGIVPELFETTRERHAVDYMKAANVENYDGVVIMGGDGTIHEVFQGLRAREDNDNALRRLKLGVIGTGTSNGLAKSLTHASEELHSPLESAFLIAKGQTCSMDLSWFKTTSASFVSFLTFSWAMVADIDIESEALRCLGFLRIDLWAVWRVANLRTYRAKFSYLPPPKKLEDRANALKSMPALTDPVPDSWVKEEGDFILFWSAQVTHAAEHTFNSPNSKFHDGIFQILLIRAPCPRIRVARVLLALDSGTHVSNPAVEFVECIAFRLEPITSGSFNDLDGEVIESGPIQGHVLPSYLKLFGKSP